MGGWAESADVDCAEELVADLGPRPEGHANLQVSGAFVEAVLAGRVGAHGSTDDPL